MKKMRVLAVVMAAIVLFAALTACGSSNQEAAKETPKDATQQDVKKEEPKATDQKVKIGFASTNLSNEYQVYMRQSAEAKAKELGISFVGMDGQGNAEKQISQIESFIAEQVNAICLAPTDANACAPAVEKAVAAKIPIIIVNSTVSNLDKATSYVGSDDTEAGKIEMQAIADILKGKGNIVVLHGPIGNSAEQGRTNGINEILKKYPDIKIIAEQPGNWDRAQGMSIMENWLQSGKQINAVVGQNDEMALGAYKAIESAKKQKDIVVIGIDAIPDALKAVEEGKLVATVFQDAKGQGAKAVEVAVAAAKGEKVEKNYLIPFQLVTKDNIANFKK